MARKVWILSTWNEGRTIFEDKDEFKKKIQECIDNEEVFYATMDENFHG